MTTATRPASVTDTTQSAVDPQIMRAWSVIVVAMAVASFAAIVTRAALNTGIHPLMTSTGRLTIAFVLLSPLVWHRYRAEVSAMSRPQWIMGIFAGFWMCLHFSLIALSLENTRIAVMQVLVNTSPIIVAVLETVVLRTKLPRVVWVGLILTILGGGVIGLDGIQSAEPSLLVPPEIIGQPIDTGNPALGALFALISAAAAAIYLTIGRKARAGISLVPYMWMLTGAGTVTGVAILLLTDNFTLSQNPAGYFWVLLLALGPQLVTHSGINYAVAYIPATVVSISAQFVSVSASLIAFALFAEVPTLPELIGGGIIVGGVIFTIIGQSRRPSHT